MSKRVKDAIEARERKNRGYWVKVPPKAEPETYHDVQEKAKDLGIPANQSREDLEKAIEKKDAKGSA
jgi:hypothetical protein